MPSGSTLIRKLIESKGVVHFSIYDNHLEPGWNSQGFTNEFRIKQAERFYGENLNTTLTIICDPTQSIEGNAKQGSSLKSAIELHEKIGIPLRLQSLQINSKKFALDITGETWENLLEEGRFRKKTPSQLHPSFLHPDFKELIKNGMGVCGEIGDFQYCDKCNLQPERIKFPLDEKVKVRYKK